ncbi:MAG: hypothetical protein JXB88_26660 [Spirochaetales bacterium]|nr:hypothetical protein [Spirochaetales bacterium]
MEIDRRLFCKLLLFSSVSLLAGCIRPSRIKKSIACNENGYPGKVIPLDRNAIRRIGKWAG